MKKKNTIKYKLKSFFKSLSYQIFFYIYGKIKVKNKINKNIFTEKSISLDGNKKNSKYSVLNVSNARLYTDRIQDTGVMHDNLLIPKASFQLRENNFDKNIKPT